MRFEVVRSLWYRGKGAAKSVLLREEDDLMCCVGFYAIALGLSQDDILAISTLNGIHTLLSGDEEVKWVEEIEESIQNSEIASKIYELNDDGRLTEEEREEGLTELFTELGHQIVFVDEATTTQIGGQTS